MLQTIPESKYLLCRDGTGWRIVFENDVFYLQHSEGLNYLARLLENPGRKIPAPEIVRARPVLDAASSYKERLSELRDELEDARSDNDVGRCSQLVNEIERTAAEALGVLSPKDADADEYRAWERARKRVSNALRRTLTRVERYSAALGDHLSSTLRTGLYCCYRPDPRSGIRWMSISTSS